VSRFSKKVIRTNRALLCLVAGVALAAPVAAQQQKNQPAEPTSVPLPTVAPLPPSAPPRPTDAAPRPGDVVIESVQIIRNRYIPADTLLYYISVKAGDRFDEERLQEDFRRLWDTGFLEDLVLHVDDSPTGGKIVTFQVDERKRIQFIDYRGSKAVSSTAIEDELKKREAALRVDSFFDLGRVRRVEAIITQMLAEKGRPFAKVKHETKPVGSGGVQVSFVIDEGARIKVKEIDFVGNTVFPDSKLRGAMKNVRTPTLTNFGWLSAKNTYTEDKWFDPQEGDRRRIEDFYLNNGYVTASVGEPKISYFDGRSFWRRRPVKYMRLEIPVLEGEQYRVGKVDFEGLTVFRDTGIRTLFKLQEGDVYREARLKKGYEKLRELYGSQGYFQWHGYTKRKPDAEKKVVDVTLAMEEDKRYYVGRITFVGNDVTRDKVIRREVYMNEGDVFNTEALRLSIRRVNQLGYFKPMEGPPEISPSAQGDDKMDVTFKVEEQNRNQFTFGAGVSGIEGTFVNASFSTTNFVGAGETFQVSLQSGARTKHYQVAVTEPYLFDRPITAGIDVYKKKIEYQSLDYGTSVFQGYVDDRTGFSLTGGLPAGRFTRLFANYAFEIVKISSGELDPNAAFDITRPFVQRDPLFFEPEGTRYESRLSPSLVHNTVDNPYSPRSGKKLSLTLATAGGPLGGNMDYFKPTLEAVLYLPHTRRTALGVRAETAWIAPFGETAEIDPSTGRERLPFYQRFYLMLGGEQSMRGFDSRTIGPVDERGLALANKYVLLNAEYYFDVSPMLRTLVFFDAGKAYKEGDPFDTTGYYTSTGVEVRFIMPVLNVPFRLIYAKNLHRDAIEAHKGGFKFAVGSTF
jgi:outer membrane protein insertion porin family